MRTRNLLLLALVVPALALLGACGQKDAPTPTGVDAPADLAGLVPADSDLLLYIPSVDDLQAKVRRVVGAVDPEAVEFVDVDQMLGEVAGPLLDLLDRTKPLAMAMKMTEDGQPMPTMVLPVQDVEQAKKRFADGGMLEPMTKGAYVQMAMGPAGGTAGDSPLTKDMPEGDLVVRVDLAGLVEQYKDEIDGALGEVKRGMDREMPVPGMGKMMEGFDQILADLIASAEGLDLAAHVDGTEVHLKVYFTAKEGSPLADAPASPGGLASLAGALPGDYPIAMLMSMDMKEIWEWMKPMMDFVYEMYPENLRDGLKEYMAAWEPMYEKMGDQHAFAMDMSAKGMRMVGVSVVGDPKAFMDEYQRIVTEKGGPLMAEMGMEMGFEEPRTVAGSEVRTMRMAFDWDKMMKSTGQGQDLPPEASAMVQEMVQKMFGGDTMSVHMAGVGDRLVWTFGGDDELLKQGIEMAAGGAASGGLAKAIETAGGSPTFLMYLEGRGFAKGLLDMVREIAPPEAKDEIPSAPEGAPVPLVIYGSADGRHYMGGMSVDVQAVVDLVKGFMD